MTVVAPSAIRDAIVARVSPNVPRLTNRISAEPPEAEIPALVAWVGNGPTEYLEWGLLVVSQPQYVITVAVPRKGNYPGEYRTVTDVAQEVADALQGGNVFAGEAVIASTTIDPPTEGAYAGKPVVVRRVNLTLEMKQQNVAAGA